MAEIISIDTARRAKDQAIEQAFDAYVAAQEKAKRTLDLRDGMDAGKAWAKFIYLFIPGGAA